MATNLPLSTVVDISITRTPSVPQQVNFGLACFVTSDTAVIPVQDRYRIYDDLAEVEGDFISTTPEYKLAEAFFGQSPQPSQIMFACVDLANSETYVEALTEAYMFKQFYVVGVVDVTLIDADVLAIAAYVQANIMLFLWQSDDAGIITTGTTDIAALLQAQGYDRTHCDYTEYAATERLDAANAGMATGRTIGTYNWMFRELAGITPTSATSTQITNAQNKYCNLYVTVGGFPMTESGFTSGASLTFADQIQAQDWLQITLQTQIFATLIDLPKVPYTDQGVKALEAVVYGVLSLGVSMGLIASDPQFTVTADPVASVPSDQRSQRIAPTIYFTCTLSGCVNKVVVNGTLAV